MFALLTPWVVKPKLPSSKFLPWNCVVLEI